jgi:hypothetical protein
MEDCWPWATLHYWLSRGFRKQLADSNASEYSSLPSLTQIMTAFLRFGEGLLCMQVNRVLNNQAAESQPAELE